MAVVPDMSFSSSSMSSSPSTVIEHVVLLKVKSNASDDELKAFVEGVQSLKAIPGVISITVGSTFVEEWMPDRRNGHTHTLSCRLESKDALRIYQDHPLHEKVKKESIVPILAGPLLAVDYESVVVLGDSTGK